MLRRRGARSVGRVVHRDHEELRTASDQLARYLRERVLETDRGADRRDIATREGLDAPTGDAVHRDLLERLEPRETFTPRDVLAERDEVDLVVTVDLASRAVEEDSARPFSIRFARDGTDERGCSHVGDRRPDPLLCPGVSPRVRIESAFTPYDEVGG